jgi:hypothetical protein
VVGIVRKNPTAEDESDRFIFGLPGYFNGYWPGYSRRPSRPTAATMQAV